MCLKFIIIFILSTTLFNCGSLSVTNSPKSVVTTVLAAEITDRAQTSDFNFNYRNNSSTTGTNSANVTITVKDQLTSGQYTNTAFAPRDKRGSNFHLDSSEIERQNNITQQIFANYLERRLFPYRSVNRKIPTIDDILPKAAKTTTTRPRHRGFGSSHSQSGKKRGEASNQHSFDGAHNKNRRSQNRVRTKFQQLVTNGDFSVIPGTHKAYSEDEEDDIDEGLEALQSVESEQHDQYYGHVLNRDPSENEIDSGDRGSILDTLEILSANNMFTLVNTF